MKKKKLFMNNSKRQFTYLTLYVFMHFCLRLQSFIALEFGK